MDWTVIQEGRKVSWYYQTPAVAWYDAQVQQKKGFYMLLDMMHIQRNREVYLELTTPRKKKYSTKNKGDKLNKKGKKFVLFRDS